MDYKITFNSLLEMVTKLPTEKHCREYLEHLRWSGKTTCAHCGHEKVYKLNIKGEFNGLYKCGLCRKRFTVKVGTIFEASHISLQKWLFAIFMFTSHKKGISSHQLAKDLCITQKSAWFMLCRIRFALEPKEQQVKFNGLVSCDETFVGGKNKNRHHDKKVPFSQGRSYKDKTPVFGLIHNGKIVTRVIPDTQAKTLKPIIRELVEQGSIVISDEWMGYWGLNKDYEHIIVNHQKKQYSNEGFSSNDVENFWSHLKRGIYGIYHKVDRKHLHRYTAEFTYRFNMRDMGEVERFEHVLGSTEKLRLRYRELIAKAS